MERMSCAVDELQLFFTKRAIGHHTKWLLVAQIMGFRTIPIKPTLIAKKDSTQKKGLESKGKGQASGWAS